MIIGPNRTRVTTSNTTERTMGERVWPARSHTPGEVSDSGSSERFAKAVSVEVTRTYTREQLRELAAECDVDVANLNAPGQIVLSGSVEGIEAAAAKSNTLRSSA